VLIIIVVNVFQLKQRILKSKPANNLHFLTPDLVVEETGEFIPEQQAYLQLVYAANILQRDLGLFFKSYGLSGKQYNVLRAIRRAGSVGITCSQIAAQMIEQDPDVTRLVDRLEKMNLATRATEKKDRRIIRVYLTDDGENLLSQIDVPLIEKHCAQLNSLSKAELMTLIKLMSKVRQS
jgi:DNA-binding MarR family transcriptional regulator